LVIDGFKPENFSRRVVRFYQSQLCRQNNYQKNFIGLPKPTSGIIHTDGGDLKPDPLEMKKSLVKFWAGPFYITKLRVGNA